MKLLKDYWAIFIVIVSIVFNVGYTVNELNSKIDRTEVNEIIDRKIQTQYVRIDQVPGLNERLKSIDEQLKENKLLTQKIYEKLLK